MESTPNIGDKGQALVYETLLLKQRLKYVIFQDCFRSCESDRGERALSHAKVIRRSGQNTTRPARPQKNVGNQSSLRINHNHYQYDYQYHYQYHYHYPKQTETNRTETNRPPHLAARAAHSDIEVDGALICHSYQGAMDDISMTGHGGALVPFPVKVSTSFPHFCLWLRGI